MSGFEVRPLYRTDTYGDKTGMDPRLLARRQLVVRSGQVAVDLPPYHTQFNPLDPLTWYVKGAGYSPQRAPAVGPYSPFFPV